MYGSFLACAYRAPSSLGPVLDRTEMTLTIQRLLECWTIYVESVYSIRHVIPKGGTERRQTILDMDLVTVRESES